MALDPDLMDYRVICFWVGFVCHVLVPVVGNQNGLGRLSATRIVYRQPGVAGRHLSVGQSVVFGHDQRDSTLTIFAKSFGRCRTRLPPRYGWDFRFGLLRCRGWYVCCCLVQFGNAAHFLRMLHVRSPALHR